MTVASAKSAVVYERNAVIPTWFGVGGRADRFARVDSAGALARCLDDFPDLRVLGDGANLLVDDDGAPGLVVSLTGPLAQARWPDDRRLVAGAGANLMSLVAESVRRGLAGLERIAGIPATVGGAIAMNAGGAYGQIADTLEWADLMTPGGRVERIAAADLGLSYRASKLAGGAVVSACFKLTPAEPAPLRARFKDIMAAKKASQPMAAKCAGCVFKNPALAPTSRLIAEDLPSRDGRVSAGLLIDRAGCKGLSRGGASVSDRHANFIVTSPAATARDVLELMALVRARVADRFGVTLENEVVIWRRES